MATCRLSARDSLSSSSSSVSESQEKSSLSDSDSSSPDEEAEMRHFACALCAKRVKTERQLKLHISIHTGDRPYSCQYCPKSFNKKFNAKRHMKEMHKRKSKTSLTAVRKSVVEEHTKRSPEEPFSICGRSSKSDSKVEFLPKTPPPLFNVNSKKSRGFHESDFSNQMKICPFCRKDCSRVSVGKVNLTSQEQEYRDEMTRHIQSEHSQYWNLIPVPRAILPAVGERYKALVTQEQEFQVVTPGYNNTRLTNNCNQPYLSDIEEWTLAPDQEKNTKFPTQIILPNPIRRNSTVSIKSESEDYLSLKYLKSESSVEESGYLDTEIDLREMEHTGLECGEVLQPLERLNSHTSVHTTQKEPSYRSPVSIKELDNIASRKYKLALTPDDSYHIFQWGNWTHSKSANRGNQAKTTVSNGKGNFRCKNCGKRFKRIHQLNGHQRAHSKKLRKTE